MDTSIGMHSDRRQSPPNRDLESGTEETAAFLTEKGWLQSLLHLREMQEQQIQRLNAVHDILQTRGMPEEERRLIVDNWMQQISRALQPIINVCPGEIAKLGTDLGRFR